MRSVKVAQFAMFPPEEGWVHELHQGRLIRMPGPGGEHSLIQMWLGAAGPR